MYILPIAYSPIKSKYTNKVRINYPKVKIQIKGIRYIKNYVK